jgi:glycerol-3-phosphate O-acyltransferase
LTGLAPAVASPRGGNLFSTIAVPVWLVVLAGFFAAWAVLDRILLPSVRWLIRSRAEKVIDEIGARLAIKIRPFQQTHRRVLIDRLIFDEKVQDAIAAFARKNEMPREVALDQVRRYAREIVPAFNAYLYFRVGYWIAKRFSRAIYRVRIGYTDDAGLAQIPENATVVFVMNHRSNMDYVLASYLAAKQAALSYAVGEWARIWPVQQLIRAMGAYFVRRNSKDELYRRVLERYISMATEAGVTQAMYPEGKLSRDGRIGDPRYGVIDYMLRGFKLDGERDLVFVPVGLNYDRTLEDRSLLLAVTPDAAPANRLATIANAIRFVVNQLYLMARSRWYRFGYACVNFGSPISVRDYVRRRGVDFAQLAKDDRSAEVANLGRYIMARIGELVPVLPVPLVATVLLNRIGRPISEFELKSEVASLAERLEARGARIYLPRSDWDYAVGAGLRMLTLRHLVDEQQEGLFVAREDELRLLRYYANSIAHLTGS